MTTPLMVARNRAARLSAPPVERVRCYTTTTGDAPRGPSRAERADRARYEAIAEQVAVIERKYLPADGYHSCCQSCTVEYAMTAAETEQVAALWAEWSMLYDRWNA